LSDFAAPSHETPLEIDGLVSWVWYAQENKVVYSREWRNVLLRPDDGRVESDLEGWWPYVHDDDVQPFLEAARDVVEGETDYYQTLFRVRRADGEWAWLLSRGRVVEKDGDTPTVVRGALMDISFLRQDVKFQHGAMGMSVPRYHPVRASSFGNGGEAPSAREGGVVSRYLPVGARMFEAAGEKAHPDMGDDEKKFVRRYVEKVFAGGFAIREIVTFPTEYGHDVTGEYIFWPEFDGQGNVVAVMSQFWDITDVILAEQRARLNEMRLDALYRLTQMANAPEKDVLAFAMDSLVKLTESRSGFLFFPEENTDNKGRVVWSLDHYTSLDGQELSSSVFPHELASLLCDGAGGTYTRVIRNGNCLQPVRRLFGGRMDVYRYIAAPVYEEGRLVCIAGVCNKEHTEYREDDLLQLEAFVAGVWLVLGRHAFIRELQQAKDAAEQANRVKDEFLANVSHELRTPLNGMLSMLQLLDILPLDEQQREYVRTASVSGKALLRIISDILDFSRIESGKMKLQIEPFDFAAAFESSLSLFRQEAEKKGLWFSVRVGEGVPARMLGDDARVRQILFNIVGNALKFTEKGGIRVECSALPSGPSDHVWVQLAVSDTGIGIPRADQSRIFEAFTQIDSSSTRKYAGTGLGLSIVRHLVGLMGGSVSLESEVGKGTTVHCSLRFARLPAGLDVPGPAEGPRELACGEALRILVAEDDDVSRFAMQTFLTRLGHQPVCVSNGRLALEMLQLCRFDCLFTDIQMPDMDGLEVVRRIREDDLADIVPSAETRAVLCAADLGENGGTLPVPKDIVTVTVSAHTMRGDKERFLEAGMDFYISKPIVMKELAAVLEKVSERIGHSERAERAEPAGVRN